ncbi:glycosyl hydrolase [Aspergillus pseudodeflectus]|uniref:Glycosyl hydrolase n=1 Tax=Aspergillus pseudodeflectus TaxID=176178 RepID=A0ABR4JJ14_9EURO
MAHEITNPIIPGFAPDPSIVLVDGIYYLVTSSFHLFPGLPIYTSTDLKGWTLLGHAYNRRDQLSLEHATSLEINLDTGNKLIATLGLYAATIRYHQGKFYVVCTNSILHPTDGWKLENFILTTTDIASSDWSDPVYFNFKGIDPDLFFDDDSTAYIQGSWTIDRTKQPSCTIKQVAIDVETGAHLSEPNEIWTGWSKYDTEGPHIYKVGGWYYLLVAEGGTFEGHHLSIARSRSVSGPFESFEKNPILTARDTNEYIQNVGHGDLFEDSFGQWWAVVLGVRGETGWPLGRESFLAPVEWTEDGWPCVTQPKKKFVLNRKIGKLSNSKEKEEDNLELVHIRNPEPAKYEYSSSNHAAHIKLSPSPQGLSAPSGPVTFLGKRQRALASTATVSLAVNNQHRSNITAGLALFKDHLRYASIVYDFKSGYLRFHATNPATGLSRTMESPLALNEVGDMESATVDLRIQSSADAYTLSFRLEASRDWSQLGYITSQELFVRDFTGPIFGVFAQGEETGNTVEFRHFRVEIHD